MENPFCSASRRSEFIFNRNIVSSYTEQSNINKRQLFLRSYQFSRKKSVSERIKGYAVKVKRFILFRLRSVRKLRKIAWSTFCFRRGRRFRFLSLVNYGDFDAADGMRHKSSFLW